MPTSPLILDPIAEWRAWQVLRIYFTVLLNRQVRRRWQLEQKCMQDTPASQRFRPVIFMEQVPSLQKPRTRQQDRDHRHSPYNRDALEKLKTRVRLIRARVEKGKELAGEIERRMLDPYVQFPSHFCHSCVVDGDVADILLSKCGHRICVTCLSFVDDVDGVYECNICFVPVKLLERYPLPDSCEQFSKVSRLCQA
ncbi:hypothetical protein N7495_002552 [Penicillium taxi]|uniref:uncharacterized protein n=1 Tax=Penicillium taxi TaxID=168475 RepID=UPI002544F076|nr:uncharacterized protein N7495_002552 [Penicillium taxi]KAJ5902024.1 hypothetical protein N7495_002552 [Penicillium taxi]